MTEKKQSLLEKIIAVFEGGDKAKVEKFLKREVKKCKNAIKSLNHNLTAEASTAVILKEKLEDAIEDATEAVENAYENIKAEDVKNNATMDEFATAYWEGVETAEYRLDEAKDKLDVLEEVKKEGGNIYVDGSLYAFEGSDYIEQEIEKQENRSKRLS